MHEHSRLGQAEAAPPRTRQQEQLRATCSLVTKEGETGIPVKMRPTPCASPAALINKSAFLCRNSIVALGQFFSRHTSASEKTADASSGDHASSHSGETQGPARSSIHRSLLVRAEAFERTPHCGPTKGQIFSRLTLNPSTGFVLEPVDVFREGVLLLVKRSFLLLALHPLSESGTSVLVGSCVSGKFEVEFTASYPTGFSTYRLVTLTHKE